MGELWIEHDGHDPELTVGTRFECRCRDGTMERDVVTHRMASWDGVEIVDGELVASPWRWARQTRYWWYEKLSHTDIIAYRIISSEADDIHEQANAENEARDKRMVAFRDLIKPERLKELTDSDQERARVSRDVREANCIAFERQWLRTRRPS